MEFEDTWNFAALLVIVFIFIITNISAFMLLKVSKLRARKAFS